MIPFGDFSDGAGVGFGGTVTGIYSYTPQIAFTGTAGYLMFGSKSAGTTGNSVDVSTSAIPIMAGARYFLQPGGEGPTNFCRRRNRFHICFVSAETSTNPFTGETEKQMLARQQYGICGTDGRCSNGNLDLAALIVFSDANYFGARVGYTIPIGK
ncbi:MAG: hypothetical protein R3C26_12260 [Calditrichia bacterium]